MAAMTITRPSVRESLVGGISINSTTAELATESVDHLREAYRGAVAVRVILVEMGETEHVPAVDAFLARLVIAGKAVTTRTVVATRTCGCDMANYVRCNTHRAQDAQRSGNWRDQFRAYND